VEPLKQTIPLPTQHSTHSKSAMEKVLLPSQAVSSTMSDPQQASTQPGDGNEVHMETRPEANTVEVPGDRKKVPFKEQVVGGAKKIRGTVLGKPELKQQGQQILDGKESFFTDEPQSTTAS